ncbi:thiamine pyrophosphate-binding protein [Corynebacterium anserum]|nr:thiamine pyrophosphate-binding protein [Corynebacterium anserum]
MTISRCLAEAIADRHTTTFGLVGNGNIHMISELVRIGGDYVGMRHEAGTVAAADAYYRATGTIAVASTTYGPGFTNTITSLSEAKEARIPLVYVAGMEPFVDGRFRRRPIDIDTPAILSALDVPVYLVQPSNTRGTIDAAFRQAEQMRTPVVLAVPHNLVDATLDSTENAHLRADLGSWYGSPGAPSMDSVRDEFTTQIIDLEDSDPIEGLSDAHRSIARGLIKRLLGAQRPLIVSGRGVVESETGDSVKKLGDEVGALFATTAMARRVVGDEWNLGICGGFAHHGRLSTFRQADVVLVLGAGLNALQTRKGSIFGEGAHIIRVDWDPSVYNARKPFIPVHRHVDARLEELVPALLSVLDEFRDGTELTSNKKTWRETIGQIPERESEELDPGCFAETGVDGKLDPRYVLRRLNEMLPEERSVVTDGGHFLGWVGKYLDVPDPRSTILVGGAVMSIGLGLPSGTGVAAARPERYTALLSGDGGTQMAAADLGPFLNQVRNSKAGGALIVFNDAAYGAEIHQYAIKGLDERPMLLEDMDFASMGAPFGVQGLSVTSPEQLKPGGEVEQFLAQHAGDACILDVKISRVPVADFLKE